MIRIRKAQDRGHTKINWLNSRHTFSFGRYQDPDFPGFASLRVINDDHVAPGMGFDTHPHHDMEIITIVLDGALEHRDSTGGGGVLRPGDVQAMSAGSGLTHSEFNHSAHEPVHFYQIWLLPDRRGHAPRYDQRRFDMTAQPNELVPLVSGDGRHKTLAIHQDAVIYRATLELGAQVEHALAPGRVAWIQVLDGQVSVNEQQLDRGDGAAIEMEPTLRIASLRPADVLLFDMAQ